MADKPRIRVKAGPVPMMAAPGLVAPSRRPTAFDAGKATRRLRGVPTARTSINTQIRRYGATVLARSRYLAANNPYAASAKEAFVTSLVGDGIKPTSAIEDRALKRALQQAWLDWTDEADADGLTDFYGLQAVVAAEMFEAGECFVRLRPRRVSDGLVVPLQLQLLPAEMLRLEDNRMLPGERRVECGIEFDAIGRRVGYHFLRGHPGDDQNRRYETTFVPAGEVLHLFRPVVAGQIRGIPHTLSAIAKLALMDQYDDAELARKGTAALFTGFVIRPSLDDDEHPLEGLGTDESVTGGVGLEPGSMIDLDPGEDVKFAAPADVGGSYEPFQYRNLLSIAAGFGVPYADMTGDLRQTSYGSIRAGLVQFRRRIEAMQHHVMAFQFCRPVWRRWLAEAVLAQAVPIAPSRFLAERQALMRVAWKPPRWDWVDPLKDIQAEVLAVENKFKSRSAVVDETGEDAEEVDREIAADRERERELGIDGPAASAAPAAPVEDDDDDDDEGRRRRDEDGEPVTDLDWRDVRRMNGDGRLAA